MNEDSPLSCINWQSFKEFLQEENELQQVSLLKKFGSGLRKLVCPGFEESHLEDLIGILADIHVNAQARCVLRRTIVRYRRLDRGSSCFCVLQSLPDTLHGCIIKSLQTALTNHIASCDQSDQSSCRVRIDTLQSLMENFSLGEAALKATLHPGKILQARAGVHLCKCALERVKTARVLVRKCYSELHDEVTNIDSKMRSRIQNIRNDVCHILKDVLFFADCQNAAGMILIQNMLLLADQELPAKKIADELCIKTEKSTVIEFHHLPPLSKLFICQGVLATVLKDQLTSHLVGDDSLLEMMFQQIWCLVPDRTRSCPKIPDPMTKFESLSKDSSSIYDLHEHVPPLDHSNLSTIQSVFDYRCLVSGGDRVYIMGVGVSMNFSESVALTCLVLSMYACYSKGSGQRRITAIHIIDCMWLAGQDVRQKHFTERIGKAELFVRSISRPSRQDLTPIRVKEVFRLEQAEKIFERLEMRAVKGSRKPRLCFRSNQNSHFLPCGLHFVKITNEPWTMNFSRSQKRKYFFNLVTNESLFECPSDSIASFRDCHKTRLLWKWEDGVVLTYNTANKMLFFFCFYRIGKAELFVRSISRPSRQDLTPIRVKEVFRLEQAEKIFERLEMRAVKGSRKPRLCFRSNQNSHFLPCGLHFVKITNEPWTMNFSRSQKRKYFFNLVTNESLFECPSDSIASFRDCHKTRLLWKWEDGVVVHDVQSNRDEHKLSKDDILNFVQRKIPR
ncbi:uncharacterized protein LOC117105845 [Anneissia japonica]|uniref:uncharacterized protein LOC117105845 n=1 Tax=Anneissia japonica TaxID=1529436 RepID=UPI0014254D50|nr:uncharacterized protein LOC117105845 [Anneissia japonica]